MEIRLTGRSVKGSAEGVQRFDRGWASTQQASEKRNFELQILLATYTDLRASARYPATISVTLYSLLWFIFAALAQAFASSCDWKHESCGDVSDWAIAIARFLPVAVMAFLLMLILNDRLRDYYLYALEEEITSKYKASAPFRDESCLYMPSFHIVRSPSWVAERAVPAGEGENGFTLNRPKRWLIAAWKRIPSILWALVYAPLVTGQAVVIIAVNRLTDAVWFLIPLIPSLLLVGIGIGRLGMGRQYAERLLNEAPDEVRAPRTVSGRKKPKSQQGAASR